MKTKSLKKIVSFIVAVSLVVTLFSVIPITVTASAATVTSGTTGDCTWTLDGTHLTISGNGNMGDYNSYSSAAAPWGRNITSVTIERGVNNIGGMAFYYCTDLTNITIPDSVKSINWYAFSDCTGLTNVNIPNSVTSIAYDTFSGCTNLADIKVPDSVKSIGSRVFTGTAYYNNNENWTDDVLYVGNHLVDSKKDKIKGDYAVRQGTKTIAGEAFYSCKNITGIAIPDSVAYIGDRAFNDCTSLTSITIPDSVTSIGDYAFVRCTGLTSITIPDSVTSIGSYTFYGCTGLTSITIPDSVTNIDSSAFNGCTGLTSITIPDSVTSIDNGAFDGCTKLKRIIIPDSVTRIGINAFYGCKGLTNITIPNSVTSIGVDAFYNTAYYNNDNNWTNGVLYIGNHLIEAKKDIINGDYTIRQGIKCIAQGAFQNCTGLTSITIPDSVTSIGYSAFFYCTRLTSITIPDSVTSIGGNAFYDCTGLTSVTIPDSVTSIGQSAFYGCRSLKDVYYTGDLSAWCKIEFNDTPMGYATNLHINGKLLEGEITIPDDITDIGNSTFYRCQKLTGVIIGNGITNIGDYAFSGCTGITSITMPDSVTNIGWGAFSGCTSLTSVTIPDSVTSISEDAFRGCTGLTSITIPDSVTDIGSGAFSGCTGLTSVTIGNSVTSIGQSAFSGCTNLTTIMVDENNINYSSVDGVLYNSGKSVLIKCPEDKKGEFIIPDSVTSICSEALLGCAGLTSITIPDSVISIGYDPSPSFIAGTLEGCTNLKDVYYTGDLSGWCKVKFAYYKSNPMCYATNLYISGKLLEGEITIPDDVTSIGEHIFYGCKSLTGVIIGNRVTSIGWNAFYGCTGLTSITIPDSVTSIGHSAFSGCTGLTNVTIGNSVTSIDWSAFRGCTSLTSIIIPDSVTTIGWQAFGDCKNLVIKTPENSAAHKYAVENNIKYELIEPVTVEGDDKNITISTDSSVIPSEGVSLSAEKVENIGEKYETQLKNLGTEKFTAYNIDLMKGEEKVQPNGKVTVSIAVPDGMDGAKCKVYRAESDGTLTDMKASLNDGKLTFTTDHFSLYIITQSAVKLGDVDGDGQITIKDAIAILRHNAEVELLTGSQIIAGDLNGDGTVNPKDAILLLQYNAQIIDKFPIE